MSEQISNAPLVFFTLIAPVSRLWLPRKSAGPIFAVGVRFIAPSYQSRPNLLHPMLA